MSSPVIDPSRIQLKRAGGMVRARLEGHPDNVLADNPSEAMPRLNTLLSMRSVVFPKHCDLLADKLERRGEAAAAKAARKAARFSPKRG
jgi:hypothetical protein